jgi:hypothetical protein
MNKPVITDLVCKACKLCWLKNHMFGADGSRVWVGYYHRCGASASGKMDGAGPIVRVGRDMQPREWDEPIGMGKNRSVKLAM